MNTVKSAARVLDILELIGGSPAPLGVNEIGRRLRIPKSSVSVLLATLMVRGYAEKDARGTYLLRHSVPIGGLSTARLVSLAMPLMKQLVERTGETSYLGVLTPDGLVQYVHKVVSPREVRYDSDIAAPRAAYNISAGRVLLAFQPSAQLAAYLRRIARDPAARRALSSVEAFRRELTRVRRTLYALSINTRVVGAAGVSAPVFGPQHSVVAALNVTAPTGRFESVRGSMIRGVVETAAELSRLLGGSDGDGRKAGAMPRQGNH